MKTQQWAGAVVADSNMQMAEMGESQSRLGSRSGHGPLCTSTNGSLTPTIIYAYRIHVVVQVTIKGQQNVSISLSKYTYM